MVTENDPDYKETECIFDILGTSKAERRREREGRSALALLAELRLTLAFFRAIKAAHAANDEELPVAA